jgi:hypothetical protein
MSDPERVNTEPGAEDVPRVPEVYHRDDDIDAVGLPDTDQLGLTPATANDETGPDDPPVPDQA